MASLYQKQILQNGTLTFGQAYGSVSSSVSILTNQVQSGYDATQAILEQAAQNQDAISGVSLEEETMNLSRFQQAYQASAQILEAAKSVMETVMEIARR
jgi:flagellar hook-associated protein 1 FlgK